jgi:hypothetical protein
MDGQKNKPTPKPIDQPNEEFIEDQPNRRDQRSHSTDPTRQPQDTADDGQSRRQNRDDEMSDMDDLAEDVDEDDREN